MPTDDEVAMIMPGDDLIHGAQPATRAITIAAAPQDIWPWLVQLGHGKAGWYSYHWIDNDFKPSADRNIPAHQNHGIGDRILMMPGMGFDVVSIDPPAPAALSVTALAEPGTFIMEQKMLRTIRDRVEPGLPPGSTWADTG